jgi:hypothetical protein
MQETQNLLEQGSKDILGRAKNDQELRTQVTSIAEEERKTGQKIEVPKPEELVARASSNLIANQQIINNLINRKNGGTYVISRKGMNRVLNAILSLPQEGLPVVLQGQEEQAAFAIGQNMIREMFIIMANHAFVEAQKSKQNSLQKEETSDIVETNQTKGEKDE